MKVLEEKKSKKKATFGGYLEARLASEHLVSASNNDWLLPSKPSTFSSVIAMEPKDPFERSEGRGAVVGGVLATDHNHIVLYGKTYLPVIKKLATEFESANEGVEVVVEIRNWKKGDYYNVPRD